MSLSIGERLRSAREAKEITLDSACRITKIQKGVLEAIEADRVEDILEPAYAKIFIKKYAAYLGLDGTALVQEYLALRGGDIPDSSLSVETELTGAKPPPVIKKVLIPAGLGLVGLIGLVFIGSLAQDFFRSAASEARKAPAETLSSSSKKSGKPIVPLSKQLKLTIRVSDEVWLQVKSDGTVIFQNVLSKGSSETWIARKELELWTGNASAMDLHLNGKQLGSLGRGVKKGVKVTHSGLEY
jgi:cytoskeletal protein RodZ